jgi:hypothetical protein
MGCQLSIQEGIMETIIFSFLSFTPGPLWLALFFCPTHKTAMKVFDIFLLLASGLFAWLTLPTIPTLLPLIAQPTLEGIQGFLSTQTGTLGAWNHMIIGDLWIGRWIAHDSLRLGAKTWLRIFFLLPTLFFGPFGLFFYLLFKLYKEKKLQLT